MDTGAERRTEKRLRYNWPVWFAEDFDESLGQGQMVDIASRAAAFTCRTDGECPFPGNPVTTRFSVPMFDSDGFEMANFHRTRQVFRVDRLNNMTNRVTVMFNEPLPFRPGEQDEQNVESEQSLQFACV